MSQNVEVVREMVEALNRKDPERFLACLAPDVEFDDREGWPKSRGMYHGRAQVRQWWDGFLDVWERVHAEVEEIEEVTGDGGGRVFLGVHGTFLGSSGTETEARAWYVLWIARGKVSRWQLFWDRGRALRAAGLVE